MRAMSLWQPWASLMVHGHKRNETRSWSIEYRGRVLIHAAKRFQQEEREICIYAPFAPCLARHYNKLKDIPLGAIIGSVHIVDCVPTNWAVSRITDQERHFGNYADGRFAWITENPVAFKEPVPFRGQQGFFNVPDELVPEEIRRKK